MTDFTPAFRIRGYQSFHMERVMNRSSAFVIALVSLSASVLAPAQTASPPSATPAWRTTVPAWTAAPASAVRPAAMPQRQPSEVRPAASPPAARSMSIPLPPGQPLAGAALQRANQALLIEARTPDRRLPLAPATKPRDLVRNGAFDGSLAPGVCVREAAIETPRGQFTPGGLIAVRGCRLGGRRGAAHMLGAFPGGRIVLDVAEWTDRMVAAEIPGNLQGVFDQDVRLLLVLADGQRSNEKTARFQARRDTVALPADMASNVNCARPQPSRCAIDDSSLFGAHKGDDSQGGRDQWGLVLGSSWALARIDYESRVGDIQASARDWTPGRKLLSVDWRSQRNIASTEYLATYKLRLFVTGPAGVPLTADTP